MITEEHAGYLINLPKKLIENDILLEEKLIQPQNPFKARFYLASEQEEDYSFFLDVKQSAKQTLKFTLHCQENSGDYGLLRVDFNGRHKNPEIANENVPAAFVPYTGMWLDDYPGHIHYIVNGYKPLVWAIPLEIDPFPVKQVTTFTDITAAFAAFCKVVNVQTKLLVFTQSNLLS